MGVCDEHVMTLLLSLKGIHFGSLGLVPREHILIEDSTVFR